MRENEQEVEVRWYYVFCPICRQKIYGMSNEEAKARVMQHIKEVHGS